MPFLDIVPVSADTIIGKFKGRFQKKNAFLAMKLPGFTWLEGYLVIPFLQIFMIDIFDKPR
jgi:hypothetical protein